MHHWTLSPLHILSPIIFGTLAPWTWKTSPKWIFECPNPSCGSKDEVILIFKSADLYRQGWLEVTIRLALKTTPKWLFECQNPSCGSKDTVILIFQLADLYSHRWFRVTIILDSKKYPRMTLLMSKSIHWIKRYWKWPVLLTSLYIPPPPPSPSTHRPR